MYVFIVMKISRDVQSSNNNRPPRPAPKHLGCPGSLCPLTSASFQSHEGNTASSNPDPRPHVCTAIPKRLCVIDRCWSLMYEEIMQQRKAIKTPQKNPKTGNGSSHYGMWGTERYHPVKHLTSKSTSMWLRLSAFLGWPCQDANKPPFKCHSKGLEVIFLSCAVEWIKERKN